MTSTVGHHDPIFWLRQVFWAIRYLREVRPRVPPDEYQGWIPQDMPDSSTNIPQAGQMARIQVTENLGGGVEQDSEALMA